MEEFWISGGTCHALFVFEVGFTIDLDQATRQAQAQAERPALRHRERATSPFEFRPAPLRITQAIGNVVIPPLPLGPVVELVLYDFGAISLTYPLPLSSSPAEILQLSIALRGHQALLADARRRVTGLVDSLGSAVQRPHIAELVEDYCIFEIAGLEGLDEGATFCLDHAEWIARVLRAETAELSRDEITDATSARISFSRTDVTLVDWDSALIIDPDPDDLRAVLEFANVQLLELRHLDDQVDQVLERSYQLMLRRTGWRGILPSFLSEDRRQLSTLQIDSAVLLERVTNALKFLGEEYLARVYRLAASRLHLDEWDGVITRKLATVESIYQKMTDQASARRMELLEWVIILLIALEMIFTVRRVGG